MTHRRWRLTAAPLLAIAISVLAAAPASAGSCPAEAAGPVDRQSYALGEPIEFFGNYTDFADPGTVTIEFSRRTDGATRSFEAGNLPDGAWMRTVAFRSRSDVGTWDVTVTLVETAQSVTCTDRVRITVAGPTGTPAPGVTLPLTDTDGAAPGQPPGPTGWAAPALIALGVLLVAAAGALEVTSRQVRRGPPGA